MRGLLMPYKNFQASVEQGLRYSLMHPIRGAAINRQPYSATGLSDYLQSGLID